MKKVILSIVVVSILNISIAVNAAVWDYDHIGEYQTAFYIPDSESQRALALMIYLKECYQSPYTISAITERSGWQEVAEEYGMIVAIPGVNTNCFGYSPNPADGADLAHGKLLNTISEFIADDSLDIDPGMIYISGLGAGGTVAMEMACRYPDVISGVGIASAAATGSDQNDLLHLPPSMVAGEVAEYCRRLAGDKTEYFQNQKAALIVGSYDMRINTKWIDVSADALAEIYEVDFIQETNDITGIEKNATEKVAVDALGNIRISKIVIPTMGHYWSSGTGDGIGNPSDYIYGDSINFPDIITSFFMGRLGRLPTISINEPSLDVNGCINISGIAADKDGTIENVFVNFNIEGIETPYYSGYAELKQTEQGEFEYGFSVCDFDEAEKRYLITATAIDNSQEEVVSNTVILEIDDILPENIFPKISDDTIQAQLDENGCLNISFEAYDPDGIIHSALIFINEESFPDNKITERDQKFSITQTICNFDNNAVEGYVVVIDNRGGYSDASEGLFQIPKPPVNIKPTISINKPLYANGCINISGIAADKDGTIENVLVNFNIESMETPYYSGDAVLEQTEQGEFEYIFSVCDFEKNTYLITATATDDSQEKVISNIVTFEANDSGNENIPPQISNDTILAQLDENGCLNISFEAYDPDGIINSALIFINEESFPDNKITERDQKFSITQTICNFDNNAVEGYAVVTDNRGGYSDASEGLFQIPKPPVNIKPTISINEPSLDVNGCINISGIAADKDGTIENVLVNFNIESMETPYYSGDAVLEQTEQGKYKYSYSYCNPEPNSYSIIATATDNSQEPVNSEIITAEYKSDTNDIPDTNEVNDNSGGGGGSTTPLLLLILLTVFFCAKKKNVKFVTKIDFECINNYNQ